MNTRIPTIALLSACLAAGTAGADTVIDSLGDNINQANLTEPVGQTFTTGTLSDHTLGSITIGGPQSAATAGTFTVSISVNGSAHTVWDPGTVLGSVGGQTLPNGTNTVFDFSSQGIVLQDNTVYAIEIASDTTSTVRFGLSNGAAGGTAGNAPGAFDDGTLFSSGGQVFLDGFDAAIQVTTVPTPSAVLGTAAMLGVMGLRRRRRND